MQISCGVRVIRVKGWSYPYVWHYETLDGRRKQVYEYIGSTEDPESGGKAANVMEEHTQKAIGEARRQLQSGKTHAVAAAL